MRPIIAAPHKEGGLNRYNMTEPNRAEAAVLPSAIAITLGGLLPLIESSYQTPIGPLEEYRHRTNLNDVLELRDYFVMSAPNTWGDTIIATINYSGQFLTEWGGRVVDGVIVWSCYND